MLIEVYVPTQKLRLIDDRGRVLMETRISTGRKGVGEVNGSEQTPRGWHQIRAKIGAGKPENTVFVARRYIYIHGCPDEDPMGIPSSHGCVKMRNRELIELFDRVPVGTRVHIIAEEP
jgi:L,D-transpeptidase YbiS